MIMNMLDIDHKAVTDGNICEIYDNNDTSCLKGTSYRTDKYEYLSKHVFTCKQVNENELAYRLVEKLTIPFELDTLYQNFDKTPQPILKNKNSVKTYFPAIYRVNGTNSKKINPVISCMAKNVPCGIYEKNK